MTSLPSRDNSRSRDLRGFLPHLLRALPVIALTTALTTAAHHFHLNDSFEFAALDTYLATVAPRAADRVVIVTITDDDYRNVFGGRSPLAPAKVRGLVEMILSQEPAVLGVDVVTAETEHAEVFAGFNDPRVVWVQDAWNDPVLGRTATADLNAGLSLFPLDFDRVVRRYYRQLTIETDQGTVTRPSFAAAVLRPYCASSARPGCDRVREALGEDASEPLWFNFAGDRYSFRKVPASAVEQAPEGLFRGKIVLLGGTFAEARDVHPTVLGEMSGVELTAFAVESELDGGGVTASNELLMIGAEVLAAIVLVWLNWRWSTSSRKMAAINGAAIVILAFAGSYIAFRRFGYWASFVPIGLGVRAHLNHERAEAAAHARKELEEYRRRYGPLACWIFLFLWPATASAQMVTVPQPLARAAVPCPAATPPCETVPQILSRHAAVGDSSTLHRYAWEVLLTLSKEAPPQLRTALGDVRRNYYRFIWVDTDDPGGEPGTRTLLVHLNEVPDSSDSLPGVSTSAGSSGPELIDVFASDDPDAVLQTQYVSTRLEDPRRAQIPEFVEASGVVGFLAGAVARTRGVAVEQPATTYAVARARLPFRRSNVTVRDTVVMPGSAAALRDGATDLRDGLMIREARFSRCAQALATSHAAAITTGATQGACSAPQSQTTALNARAAAGCRDELAARLKESYKTTAASCQDTPPAAGFDPLLVVDTKFTELVASLQQTRRTSESELVNVPRTRYSVGLLSGAILGRPKNFGATVRARVGDEGTIVQDRLPAALNMAVVNVHPRAYDAEQHAIRWPERFRFFAGTVVSPDFGVGGGAGVMIMRGLAANVGWATLFVSSPKAGLSVGDTPRSDADPLRIGRSGVFFAGLSYSFK